MHTNRFARIQTVVIWWFAPHTYGKLLLLEMICNEILPVSAVCTSKAKARSRSTQAATSVVITGVWRIRSVNKIAYALDKDVVSSCDVGDAISKKRCVLYASALEASISALYKDYSVYMTHIYQLIERIANSPRLYTTMSASDAIHLDREETLRSSRSRHIDDVRKSRTPAEVSISKFKLKLIEQEKEVQELSSSAGVLYRCKKPSCPSNKPGSGVIPNVTYETIQLKSADEGMTVKFTCQVCSHHW